MTLTSLAPTSAPPKSANNTLSLMCRRSTAEMRKIIGDRFLQARELNGLSQTEAAGLFGYQTSSQLSQWEQAKRMPPIKKILQASYVYRVSVDFLLGVSREPDRDPMSAERLMLLSSAEGMLGDMTRKLADLILAQTRTGGPTIQACYSVLQEGQKFVDAFNRFVELNPDYEDMRGGNRLSVCSESFQHNGLDIARGLLDRHRRINGDALHRIVAREPGDTRTGDLFRHDD